MTELKGKHQEIAALLASQCKPGIIKIAAELASVLKLTYKDLLIKIDTSSVGAPGDDKTEYVNKFLSLATLDKAVTFVKLTDIQSTTREALLKEYSDDHIMVCFTINGSSEYVYIQDPQQAAKGCAKCKKALANSFRLCAECKAVSYCSIECQKADWKEHKPTCNRHNIQQAIMNTLALSLENVIFAKADRYNYEHSCSYADIIVMINTNITDVPLDNIPVFIDRFLDLCKTNECITVHRINKLEDKELRREIRKILKKSDGKTLYIGVRVGDATQFRDIRKGTLAKKLAELEAAEKEEEAEDNEDEETRDKGDKKKE